MIALLFAAAVAAQSPPASPLPPPPAATAPTSQPADPPPKSAPERLADLRIMYDQTCGNRAYGAYDDLCETLGDQMRKAQREIDAPHRAKPAPAPRPPSPPPLATGPSVKN